MDDDGRLDCADRFDEGRFVGDVGADIGVLERCRGRNVQQSQHARGVPCSKEARDCAAKEPIGPHNKHRGNWRRLRLRGHVLAKRGSARSGELG